MSWEVILKDKEISKQGQMYLDATNLINGIYQQTSEDLRTIDKFAEKYSDMIDKTPVEWPLMHDYLLTYIKMKSEERDLHNNVLKQMKEEVFEGF